MAYADAINANFRRRFERRLSTPFIWRPYTNDESAFFQFSGGVSIDYRFDGTKATVTTHTNEDSVTLPTTSGAARCWFHRPRKPTLWTNSLTLTSWCPST